MNSNDHPASNQTTPPVLGAPQRANEQEMTPVRTVVEDALGKALSWTIDHGKTALALGGLVVYAIARVAVDAFYNKLQVTPDEVGLSQVTIAARAELYAIVSLTLIIAIGAASVAVLLALEQAVRHRRGKPTGTPSNARILAAISASILAIPLVLYLTQPDLWNFFTRHIALFVWVMASLIAVFGVAAWYEHLKTNKTRQGLDRAQLATILAIVAIAVWPTYQLAERRGEELGTDATNGFNIRGGGFTLLSVHADPVCLTASNPALLQLPDRKGPYLDLGTAGGTLVLYSYQKGMPLRLPAQTVSAVAVEPPNPPLNQSPLTRRCP